MVSSFALMEGSHLGLKAVNKWVVAPKRASVSTLLKRGLVINTQKGFGGNAKLVGN